MARENNNLSHAQNQQPDELEALKEWWNAHGNLVTIIVCAVLIGVIGVRWYTGRQEKNAARVVNELFTKAGTPSALEELIANNGSAKVIPVARIRLGGMYYNEEQYDLAQQAYETFLAKHPKHLFVPTAELGIAFCLEAKGEVQAALDKFTQYVEKYPNAANVKSAVLGKARTMILVGRKDEAKGILDLFMAENAGTIWAIQADELIGAMNRLEVPKASSFDLDSFFSQTADAVTIEGAEEVAAEDIAAEKAEPEVSATAAEAPAPESVPAPEAPVAESAE